MKKVLNSLMVLTFLFILVLNMVLLNQAKAETIYMAGIIKGGAICSCPVLVGKCICEVNIPDPPQS